MNGRVDSAGRALVAVNLSSDANSPSVGIEAWIDTGFTGDLVLPQFLIDDLALPLTGTAKAVLADGSQIVMRTHCCYIRWFDEIKRLEVVVNEGSQALLGIGLLLAHDLRINYRTKKIMLT
jgi:clan AA aspartic protease